MKIGRISPNIPLRRVNHRIHPPSILRLTNLFTGLEQSRELQIIWVHENNPSGLCCQVWSYCEGFSQFFRSTRSLERSWSLNLMVDHKRPHHLSLSYMNTFMLQNQKKVSPSGNATWATSRITTSGSPSPTKKSLLFKLQQRRSTSTWLILGTYLYHSLEFQCNLNHRCSIGCVRMGQMILRC